MLGKAWFLNHEIEDRPSCLIDGQPATVEEGIERAAQILCDAKYPLIYGLSDTTVRSPTGGRRASRDWIGGNVDTTTSVCHGPSGMAFQGVGEVTCTLGEVANRGDLIIFWGSNPAESHPRHFTKYSLMPKGMFVPNGRKDRTCVIVDVAQDQDGQGGRYLPSDQAAQGLRSALDTAGTWLEDIELGRRQVEQRNGRQPLAAWQDLMDRMKAAKFGVIFFGMGLTMTRGKHCQQRSPAGPDTRHESHTRASSASRIADTATSPAPTTWLPGEPAIHSA